MITKKRRQREYMKIILFDKVICEGTTEECDAFTENLVHTLWKLDDELKDTYPMKKTDTYQTYFEALKTLNPFVYETLSYFKEIAGEYFYEFTFRYNDLVGVGIRVYADLETKRTKIYSFGFIHNVIVLELRKQTIWRIEE